MIHQFNTQALIAILYSAIGIFVIIYNTMKKETFEPIYILYGCLWPLVLWFQLLILIFTSHADIRRTKAIKGKPNYFDTFEGKQAHPDLINRTKRRGKTAIKRT
jgi:hypothetical protein